MVGKKWLYIWWISHSLAATVCGVMQMEGERGRVKTKGKAGSERKIKLSRGG